MNAVSAQPRRQRAPCAQAPGSAPTDAASLTECQTQNGPCTERSSEVGDINEYVEPGGFIKGCLIWYCGMGCCYLPICMIDVPNRAKVPVARKASN